MKFFRRIYRVIYLAVALTVCASACRAEEAFVIQDTGLDLTESLSIHYPSVSGPGDAELLDRINHLIQDRCRIGEYLTRTARLLSGGNLKTDWKGTVLGDVFSCVVSAEGTLETTRNTHIWTAVNVDLRDGHEIMLPELFTDEAAARERMEAYLEETVAPELIAYPQDSMLTPIPDVFCLELSGLTLLYPVNRFSTLKDRAGDVRISWNILRDELDLSGESILNRIGVKDMITLTENGAVQLLASAAGGSLTGIPARIGDSVQEMTDRYHMLTDPDGFEGGRLFALEGGCFRGVYLMTDDLSRDWENSTVQGIRMDQGCLWGLCVGETAREEWLAVLGEPDGTTELGEEKAESNRLVPGFCDYYNCGDYLLQLYSNEDGTLVSVILAE